MNSILNIAPPWQVERWFNTPQPITLESLRGKVVVLEAFQMLCPGCVSHGLPLAMRIRAAFPPERVAVIGLHTVFEHHSAMTAVALQAFLSEYRITIPVGIDQPSKRGPIPQTMQAYGMQGTPTLILIDVAGYRRAEHFGQIDDLRTGAEIASLLGEPVAAGTAPEVRSACNDDACSL